MYRFMKYLNEERYPTGAQLERDMICDRSQEGSLQSAGTHLRQKNIALVSMATKSLQAEEDHLIPSFIVTSTALKIASIRDGTNGSFVSPRIRFWREILWAEISEQHVEASLQTSTLYMSIPKWSAFQILIWHFIASGFILPQIQFPPHHSKGNSSSSYPPSILTTSCCTHIVCQVDTASSDLPCSYPRCPCPSYTMQVPYPGRNLIKSTQKKPGEIKTTFTMNCGILSDFHSSTIWITQLDHPTWLEIGIKAPKGEWYSWVAQETESGNSQKKIITQSRKRVFALGDLGKNIQKPSQQTHCSPQLLRPRNATHGLTQPRFLHPENTGTASMTSWWLNQQCINMLVKLDHFPK